MTTNKNQSAITKRKEKMNEQNDKVDLQELLDKMRGHEQYIYNVLSLGISL